MIVSVSCWGGWKCTPDLLIWGIGPEGTAGSRDRRWAWAGFEGKAGYQARMAVEDGKTLGVLGMWRHLMFY